MKTKLREDLADSRITSLVGNNIYFLHKDESIKTDTYIEYEIISEKYEDYCGNDNLAIDYIFQVDIFSKGNYEPIEKIIKEILKEKDYKFSNGADLYENDTKLYHKAMRFNYKLIKNESEVIFNEI